MRKGTSKRIIFLAVILLLGVFALHQYMNYSKLWQLRLTNSTLSQLLKRGYLIIVPVEEIASYGMVETIGEDWKVLLEKSSYYQNEPEDYSAFMDSYGWCVVDESIKIFYYDERDTLSAFQEKSDGKLYATYELLGDDGSGAQYKVEVK